MEERATNSKHDRAVYYVLRACVNHGAIEISSKESAETMASYIAKKYSTNELMKLLVHIEGDTYGSDA